MPEFDTLFGSRFRTKPRYQSFMILANVKLLIAEANHISKRARLSVAKTYYLVDPKGKGCLRHEARSRRRI